MKKAVTFYSEGCKLAGDLYLPSDLGKGEKRAGVLLCHGYTGVKDLYLPDSASVLTEASYVAMSFDCKGCGTSEGPPTPRATREAASSSGRFRNQAIASPAPSSSRWSA